MKNSKKIAVVLDMETNDPDDYLSLLLLLGHPYVHLKAVTITPGSRHQFALVKRTLALFGRDIPIGLYHVAHPKTCVSPWHEQAFGKIVLPDELLENINSGNLPNIPTGAEVLLQNCDENTILITGAPLKNLGVALDFPDFKLGTLVAQGGFAGEGVVPAGKQLEKFKGKITCPTFNLNGDIPSVFKALASNNIQKRYFVSKNVCHGIFYGEIMHNLVHEHIDFLKDQTIETSTFENKNPQLFSLEMIKKGMDYYLKNKQIKPNDLTQKPIENSETENSEKTSFPKDIWGKNLHDPLACCCAINLNVGEWAEVEIYREKGEWGAKIASDTNTWIITDYHHTKFLEVFFGEM